MRTLFETCVPREDVLNGTLPETQFAADLQAVVSNAGRTPTLYSDAQTFFAYTYPTRGLQQLVAEVFGRFTGAPGASPNVRLETSFGGGKTHNLIALWHLARQPAAAVAASAGWLDPGALPPQPIFPVALAGDKYGAAEVAEHKGVRTLTLWGEMAWQLGQYEVMREDDESRTAPNADRLDRLFAGRRVLVLIDELPRYLRAAKGQLVGRGTLADQTLIFFQGLLGYAATHDNVVCVYSLSERQDAFAQERDEIVEQIGEARSISARQERVVTPITETEIAAVLRRRLFQVVDQSAAAEVAEGYVQHLRRMRRQGAPLPPDVEDPSYVQRMEAAFPFHPELLATLYRKTASFPTFQWARGTLRLLAGTIRSLWRERPVDAYVIQSTDLDLSDAVVRDELTSRIERSGLLTAIAQDVWSEHGDAHAQRFDHDWASKGYPKLCQRVAQAVFLHSLVHHAAQGVAGAEPAEAHLACARPGLAYDAVDKALSQLADHFWYAEFDGRRYVFRDEPTIKKLIADAAFSIGRIAAKDAVRAKAQEVFAGSLFELIPFPTGPDQVPDRGGKPLLVLLDFDHVEITDADGGVPAVIEDIFFRKGENREFRIHQNNLVVLAVDAGKKEPMIEAARKAKGIDTLLNSEEQRRRLAGEPWKKLQSARDQAQLEYRVAVSNAYCHLFYRSLHGGAIEHYELPAQQSADARREQQAVLKAVLADRGKALGGRANALAPEWVRERIWTDGSPEISLQALYDQFTRRPQAYLLFDDAVGILRTTVSAGVRQGVWVYVDRKSGKVYRPEQPPTAEQIRFDDDSRLLTPQEAAARYPVEPPPAPPTGAGGGKDGLAQPSLADGAWQPETPEEPASPTRPVWHASGEGPAPKAWTDVQDRLADAGADQIHHWTLVVVGPESTRQLLDGWSAVTNALVGASVQVTCEVALARRGEGLNLNFTGPLRHFARLHGLLRGLLLEANPDDHILTEIEAHFDPPRSIHDPHLDALARDLDETYRVGKVEVKAW